MDFPTEDHFLCKYEKHIGIDHVNESAYIRRTNVTDSLRVGVSLGDDFISSGTPFTLPKEGDLCSAGICLLDRHFRSLVGYEWPTGFIAAGLIDEASFNRLVAGIEAELEHNAREARQDETEIIKVARELKLSPSPTGTGPAHWRASCPGTNHHLYIQSQSNGFGCGWCKRKGGPSELRAFVVERRGT